MAESFNLRVVNISLNNGVMPKEFYWNELQIDVLNDAFASAQPYQTQNFRMFAPKMPLNTSPLCVALHVRNESDVERELKFFDCSLKSNRFQQLQSIVEVHPAAVRIKPNATAELVLTFRYELLGQQEAQLMISSSSFAIKWHAIVTTLEFDPASLLITNQLTPVAINLFPPPQQALWLYNAYPTDIKLGLISRSAEIILAQDEVVVGSHRRVPLLLTFSPNYVGHYELEIEIVYNGCRSSVQIHGECIGRAKDLLDFVFRPAAPSFDLISELNPFVLHGDNLCIALADGHSAERLIGLQNNSKSCIAYEWEDAQLSSAAEISVRPKTGHLKPGLSKLFRVSIKLLGQCAMQMIPIKCSISEYPVEEFTLPDGYFEFTERGFYEKPLNWSPKYLQSLYLSVNITSSSSREIIKYATTSDARQASCQSQQQRTNILPSVAADGGDVSVEKPKCEINNNEQRAMRTLISSSITDRSGLKGKQKTRSLDQHYAALSGNHNKSHTTDDEDINVKRVSLIPELMNDVLFQCISEIASEHRFVPSAW